MGIPAIVSIPNVTAAFADGQWVEMDGSAGTTSASTHRPPPPRRTSCSKGWPYDAAARPDNTEAMRHADFA